MVAQFGTKHEPNYGVMPFFKRGSCLIISFRSLHYLFVYSKCELVTTNGIGLADATFMSAFVFFFLASSIKNGLSIQALVCSIQHISQSTVYIREWNWALFMGAIHCCFWNSILLIIYRLILNRFKELETSIFIRK